MTTIASSPSPSPSHSPCGSQESINGFNYFFHLLFISKCPQGQLLTIDMSVLLTSMFMLLLFVYGGIRKRIRVAWLIPVMKGIYILIPISITYSMGMMHHATTMGDMREMLFLIWAFFLIYVYGGVTITAYDLSDNEKALTYFLHISTLFFWALLLFSSRMNNELSYPAIILCIVAPWNTDATLRAFFMASKSRGLSQDIHPLVTYMREGKDVPNEDEADPVSMRGYKYLVSDTTTTEDIWQSQGTLLRSESESERLKDLCLSFALFKLLLRRFAGFPLHESSKRKTREFVEMGLLSHLERAFCIVEVELDFIYDVFYTKRYFLSTANTFYKLPRIMFIFCCVWVALFTLNDIHHGDGVAFGATRIVLLIGAALEIWQIIMQNLSNWKIVKLACEYVREPISQKGKRIEFILCINRCFRKLVFFSFFFKPWQRKLGQYSFIHSYCRTPIMRILMKLLTRQLADLIKIPRIGQTGDSKVTLSMKVKQAIFSSLKDNCLALSPGTATLRRYELFDSLSYTCQLPTDAHVILVWHIATSVCEEEFFKSQPKDDHFEVATQLSKYCAYLLNFSPELLPDHLYTTESVFDQAVSDALVIFKGLKTEERFNKMTSMSGEDDSNIVVKGAVLGNKLKDVIRDPSKGWKVLAEFWAELLLYMTPSDNIDKTNAHGQHLAQGGEFITHLWTLLTHAGVLDRPSNNSFISTI